MGSCRYLHLTAVLLLGTVPGWCGSRLGGVHRLPLHMAQPQHGRMSLQTDGELSVEFLPLTDGPRISGANSVGVLNLGAVSYSGPADSHGVRIERQAHGFTVATLLGVRIGKSQFGSSGTASLKVWLDQPVQPYRIFFDDVPLTLQPVCVNAQTQIGVVTRHQLKIRVPSNTTDKQAQLQTVISMQVVRN